MKIFRSHKNKDKDKETKKILSEPATESSEQPEQPAPQERSEQAEQSAGQAAAQAETAADAATNLSDSRMEEIYSTKDKHVKFKRQQPLEAEAAAKRQAVAKDELKRGKLEFSSTAEDNAPEVKLEAELDPNAIVAEEIIEDVVDVKKLRNIYVQDIDDIDVSLDPMDSVRAYERRAADTQRHDARAESDQEKPYTPSGDTIVAKVPVYQHDSKVENIYLKAGRFTDVVESEYDEYLKSTDPTISKNYHAMKPAPKQHQSLLFMLSQAATRRKAESEQKQKSKEVMRKNFDEEPVKPKKEENKKPSKVKKFFKFTGSVITTKFSAPSPAEQDRSLDYNSREDEEYIANRTAKNIRRLTIHLVIYGVIALIMLALVIWERTSGAYAVAERGAGVALAYCATNLVLLWAIGFVARYTLIDGLKPLRHFKANCQTMISLSFIACLIQGIIALFTCKSFVGAEHHLYCFIVVFALLTDTAGRLLMVLRVKSNLDFISSRSPAYAAKIFNDEDTARRMVSGTTASKGPIAYQHVTKFLSDFLKISYAPDPSEELSGKVSPIAMISAAVVAILYAFIFKSFAGTVSVLTVMLCIGIPFTAMIAGNLPMLIFSRRMLDEEAMVAGYPSVRQFCDTSALILPAADLFPDGCVRIVQMVPLHQYRMEEGLLMAAAVLREAESPIAPAFDELVAEHKGMLPSVESVMYEDKSGLVGWIGGERVLVGNKKLMNRYHIIIREDFPLSKQKKLEENTTYIAVSGQAIAILALSYEAAPITKEQIRKAEHNGLALVVSTTDANITDDLIAERYGLFHRSVKVTAPGYTNVIDEATGSVEEASRAYLATRGHIGSLARSIGGCINIKTNIGLGIAIEIFGTLLGILLCATLALYASVARLSVVELIIYIGFWIVATIAAELIRRP